MRLFILILLGLAFVLNYYVLHWFYPNVETDYDQYVGFVKSRNIVYEFMFSLFFWLTYLLSEKTMKAVASFFMVLAVSSLIDKCFGIFSFLKTDYFIIAMALACAIYVYKKNKS